jgi:hypothetical protein
MTVADIARFVIISVLGILALVTFLVAGTLIMLMMMSCGGGGECEYCGDYPASVWVLGLLGILFIKSMVEEWTAIPQATKDWYAANKANVLISVIILIIFVFIFSW